MRTRHPPDRSLPPLTRRDSSIPMSAAQFRRLSRRPMLGVALAAALVLLAVAAATWWLADVSRARTFLADGDALYRAGRYSEAIATITTAIAKRPREPEAYRVRAQAYIALSDFDSAKRDLDRLTVLRPDDADAFSARAALIISWQGCSDAPLQDLTRSIALRENASAYGRRGACLLGLGRAREAMADFSRAMQLDATADHYAERASAYSAVGDHRAALADLDKAVELRPGLPDLYRFRAREREQVGDSKGAADDRKRSQTAAAAVALH